jgi:hypothetical protein
MVGPTIMALYFCDVGHGTPGDSSHLMAHRDNVEREGGGGGNFWKTCLICFLISGTYGPPRRNIHCIDFNHFACTILFDFSMSFQPRSHQQKHGRCNQLEHTRF